MIELIGAISGLALRGKRGRASCNFSLTIWRST